MTNAEKVTRALETLLDNAVILKTRATLMMKERPNAQEQIFLVQIAEARAALNLLAKGES